MTTHDEIIQLPMGYETTIKENPMKIKHLFMILSLSLGLILTLVIVFTSLAAPGNPILNPARNSHSAPLTTTVSIIYDEPMDAATVTSRTFVIHAMHSGVLTETYGVSGGTITFTPRRAFHQGELVYVIATTGTLNITGTAPLSATQWQFTAGKIFSRSTAPTFTDSGANLPGIERAVWGDYDNDGDLDVLLFGNNAPTSGETKLYRNDHGLFITDTVAGAALPNVRYGAAAAWGDYDNDGDLDILLTGDAGSGLAINPIATVYRNDNGVFNADAAASAGLTGVDYSAVAWGDYDNDGDLDILLTGQKSGFTRVSRLYRNDPAPGTGRTFTDINAGLTDVMDSAVAWGDYDNDGDLDILLAGNSSGPVTQVYRNHNNQFELDTVASAGLVGVECSAVAWGDYDNDGDLDILLSGRDAGDTLLAQVYRNDSTPGGRSFTNINAGLAGIYMGSVDWGDYDNDGDLDILLSGIDSCWPSTPHIYRNDPTPGGRTFTDIGAGLAAVGKSSARWGDYDNDGDLDILLAGAHWNGQEDEYIFRVYCNDACAASGLAADLAVSKRADPPLVAAGAYLTYTLVVTNHGPDDAIGWVKLTDTPPAGTTFVDPVFWLHLDEPAGATAFSDASGFGNHAACAGSTCPTAGVAGRYANAVQFGGSHYLTVPDAPAFKTLQFTLSAWFQWDGVGTDDVQFLTGKGYEAFEIHTGGGAGVNGLRFIPAGYSATSVDAPDVIQTGWNHIAAVYTGDAAYIYHNGTLAISRTNISGGADLTANTVPLTIGRRGDGSYPFAGRLDEVGLFSRALSAAEIANHYQSGPPDPFFNASRGTCSFAAGLVCDLGSMDAGQVATVAFRVAVAPTRTGTIANVAGVTGYVPDPKPFNNTATATVIARGYNTPPLANAGLDRSVDTLALVTLNGSGSSDPDGDLPLTYRWSQTGGLAVTFTPNLSVTTFTAPADPAVLTFTLTVTDSLGLVSLTPDEVVITIYDDVSRVFLPIIFKFD